MANTQIRPLGGSMTQTQQPSSAMAIIDYRQAPLAIEHFGEDRIAQVVEQISRGWKRPMELAELDYIGLICERTRLDPTVKPALIYFIQRFDKNVGKFVMTPQVSIDGLRIIAARSRDYVTQVGPQWCGPNGEWRDIWTTKVPPPAAARVGVVRRGAREPLWSIALWQECVQDTSFWRDRPAHMLAKTAEGNALKRACPAETNELELAHLEEMERLEVPARAAEYVRIHGSDADNSALYDLPPAYQTSTAQLASPAPPPPTLAPESPERRDTRRDGLIDMYATLVGQAIEMGVIVGSPMDWIRAAGGDDATIIEKGKTLRALVNKAAVERARSSAPEAQAALSPEDEIEWLDRPTPPAEDGDETPWERNRRLVARAAELGLSGVAVLNTRSSASVIQRANDELAARIEDAELDRRLAEEPAL